MKKFLAGFLLVTVFMQLPAFAEDPLRVRADGQIVDEVGNVIAVQNRDDPRNDDYKKYYSNVDANGRSTGTSNFYVTSDPNKGFVRQEINLPSLDQQVGQTKKGYDFAPAAKKDAKNSPKPVMVDAPERNSPTDSVYGSVHGAPTLYGN